MTPVTFKAWLADMKSTGISRSDAASGRMLGINVSSVQRGKDNGFQSYTGLRMALACAALLNGLQPYANEVAEWAAEDEELAPLQGWHDIPVTNDK